MALDPRENLATLQCTYHQHQGLRSTVRGFPDCETMPNSCVGYGCTRRDTPEVRARGITFHKIPQDPEKMHTWLRALRRKNLDPDPGRLSHYRVCSEHFTPSDLRESGGGRRMLKRDAVPSVASGCCRKGRRGRRSSDWVEVDAAADDDGNDDSSSANALQLAPEQDMPDKPVVEEVKKCDLSRKSFFFLKFSFRVRDVL